MHDGERGESIPSPSAPSAKLPDIAVGALIRCFSCRYDITSLVELRGRDTPGVCPECGCSIEGTLPRQAVSLPRCLRCGLDLAALRQRGDASLCPDCFTPVREVFRQEACLEIYERVTPRCWFRMIRAAVRSPSGFMLVIDQKRELTTLLAVMNAVICAVVLASVPTATLAMTIEWEKWHYRAIAEGFEGTFTLALLAAYLASTLSVVVGAFFTLMVVPEGEYPTSVRVLASGVLLASCLAVAWALALAPLGMILGLYPPPWGPPVLVGGAWFCGTLVLVPLSITTACYGVWKLRFLHPGRLSASEPLPGSNLS